MSSPTGEESIAEDGVEKSSPALRTEDEDSGVKCGHDQQHQPAPQRVRDISNRGAEVTEAANLDHQSFVGGSDRPMNSVIMPRRFACSRCFRCKGQSKGAPHCRVQMLHLFAPGWFKEDQSKEWEPPRGFIRWLRNEGPLTNCKTDQEVYDVALANPTTLDAFPWYNLATWGPESYGKPFPREKISMIVGFRQEESNGSDGKGVDVAEGSPLVPPSPAPGANTSKEQRPIPAETSAQPSSKTGGGNRSKPTISSSTKDKSKVTSARESPGKELGSFGVCSSNLEESGARSTVAADGIIQKNIGSSCVGSSSSGSGSGILDEVRTTRETSRRSGDVDEGGSTSLTQQQQPQQEMKKSLAGPEAEVGGTSGGGNRRERGASVDLDESPRGSSSPQEAAGGDNGFHGKDGAAHSLDVDVGGGVQRAATGLPPLVRVSSSGVISRIDVSADAIEAAALRRIKERGFGDEYGRQRKSVAEAKAGEGVAASVTATQAAKGPAGGNVASQGVVGDKPVRGTGCAEGTSGSEWKGIASVQGEHQKHNEEGRSGQTSQSPAETDALTAVKRRDDGNSVTRKTKNVDARDARKIQGMPSWKCPPDKKHQEKKKNAKKKEEEKDSRRGKDQPVGKKVREVVKVKAKEIRERREEAAKKSAALMRREHVAHWVKNRPFLGKMLRKQKPTPLIPQDLYRNALQEMQKLDERRQTVASVAPEPTPTPSSASSTAISAGDKTDSSVSGASGAVGMTTPSLTAWREETLQSLAAEWPAAAAATESAESDWSKGKEGEQGPQMARVNKPAPAKKLKDLKGYYQKNELMVTVDSARKALRARLQYWVRDIPLLKGWVNSLKPQTQKKAVLPEVIYLMIYLMTSIAVLMFVERGGRFSNAEAGIPVDMSAMKTTPDPAEWGAWAGKSLDMWKGLVPFTTEDFPRKARNRYINGAYHEEEDSEDSDDGSVVLPSELFEDIQSQQLLSSSRQRRGNGRGAARTSGRSVIVESDIFEGGSDDGSDVFENGADDGDSDPEDNDAEYRDKEVDAAVNERAFSVNSGINSRDKSGGGRAVNGGGGITGGGRSFNGIRFTSSSRSNSSADGKITVVGGSSHGSASKRDRAQEAIREASEDSAFRAYSLATKATAAERKGDRRTGTSRMVSGIGSVSSNPGSFWSREAKAARNGPQPAPPVQVSAPMTSTARTSSKGKASAIQTFAPPASLKARRSVPTLAKELAPAKTAGSDSRAYGQPVAHERMRRMSPEEMEASVQRTFANRAKAFGKKSAGSGDEAPMAVQQSRTAPAWYSYSYPPPPSEALLKPSSDRAEVLSGDTRGSTSARFFPATGRSMGGGSAGGGSNGGVGKGDTERHPCVPSGTPIKRFWKINGEDQLPPGWTVKLNEPDRDRRYPGRWYAYKRAGTKLLDKSPRNADVFANLNGPEAAGHRTSQLTKKVKRCTLQRPLSVNKKLADSSAVGSCSDSPPGDESREENGGSFKAIDEALAVSAVAVDKESRVLTTVKKAPGAEQLSTGPPVAADKESRGLTSVKKGPVTEGRAIAQAVAADKKTRGITTVEKALGAEVPATASAMAMGTESRKLNSMGQTSGYEAPATAPAMEADTTSRGITTMRKTSVFDASATAPAVAVDGEARGLTTVEKASRPGALATAPAVAVDKKPREVTTVEKASGPEAPALALAPAPAMAANKEPSGLPPMEEASSAKSPATAPANKEPRRLTIVEKTSGDKVQASAAGKQSRGLTTTKKTSGSEAPATASGVASDKVSRGLTTFKKTLAAETPYMAPTMAANKQSRGLDSIGKAPSASRVETAKTALEAKSKVAGRAAKRVNEAILTVNPKASISSSFEKKRKVEGLSPGSAGGEKRSKFAANKPSADSSASVSVSGGGGAAAVEGSSGVIGKKRRGRPLGSKNRPKDKDKDKDKKGVAGVKASGTKVGGGVKATGSAGENIPMPKVGPMIKVPGLKAAGSSDAWIPGSTCITPESSAGADGKAPGLTDAPGTTGIKNPGSTGTKTQKSKAGAGGKPSGSIASKTPGSIGVKSSRPTGVNSRGSIGVKTPGSIGVKSPGSIGVKSLGSIGVKTSGPKARIGGNVSSLTGVRTDESKGTRDPGSKAGSGVKGQGPTDVAAPRPKTAQSSDVKTPESKAGEGVQALKPPSGKASRPSGVKNPEGPTAGKAPSPKANAEGAKTPSSEEADSQVAELTGAKTSESTFSKTSGSRSVKTPESTSVKNPEPSGGKTPVSRAEDDKIAVSKESTGVKPQVIQGKAVTKASGSKAGVRDGVDGNDEKTGAGAAVRTATDAKTSTTESGPSVSLPAVEEKQAAVSSDPADEKALESPRQETSRPPTKDISSTPCESGGNVVLEENSLTLVAKKQVITSEMAGQKERMSRSGEHAEPMPLPKDNVDDSSDGWSDGDEVIGEVEEACASEIILVAGKGGGGGDTAGEAKGSIISGVVIGMEVEGQKEREVGRVRGERGVESNVGSKERKSESTVSTGTEKEVDGTFEEFNSRWGTRNGRTPAEVKQPCPPTASPAMSPVRRCKRRKTSANEYSNRDGGGSGSGSHVEDGATTEKEEDGASKCKGKGKGKEVQGEAKEDDEETNEERGPAVPAAPEPLSPSSSSSNKGVGKKVGKVMKNRVLALAAGTILPIGKRRRRAASISGACASPAPTPATASTAREAATSMRRRRSADGSGGARGADVAAGPSVTRSSRDRGGSGGDKNGSSGSSVPLRHSSRAAAAAATAALTEVFSSPYSS